MLRSRDFVARERGEVGLDDVVENEKCDRGMFTLIQVESGASTGAGGALASNRGPSGTMVAVDSFFDPGSNDEVLRWVGGGDSIVTGAVSDAALVAKLSSSSFSSMISSGIQSFGEGSTVGCTKGASSDKKRLKDSGDMSRERMLPDGVVLLARS